MTIRVVMADDHPILRQGLRRILERAPGIVVTAETDSGDGLVDLVVQTAADVVVLDISMPGPSAFDLIAALQHAAPGARILVLSGHSEGEWAVQALRAGAAGYLSKTNPPDELVAAVRRVAQGRRYVSEALAEQLAAAAGGTWEEAPHTRLSAREFEVLRLMTAGKSLKEIGALLRIHPKTVSTFRQRILTKLGVRSNAELVLYAVAHHLVEESARAPVQPSRPRRRPTKRPPSSGTH